MFMFIRGRPHSPVSMAGEDGERPITLAEERGFDQDQLEAFQRRWQSPLNYPDWDPLWQLRAAGAVVYCVVPYPKKDLFFAAFIEYEGRRGWMPYKGYKGTSKSLSRGNGADHRHRAFRDFPWSDFLAVLGKLVLRGYTSIPWGALDDWDRTPLNIHPWSELGIDGVEPNIPSHPLAIMPARAQRPRAWKKELWVWPFSTPPAEDMPGVREEYGFDHAQLEAFQRRWKSPLNEPDWDPLWALQAAGAAIYHVIPFPKRADTFFVAYVEYRGHRGWVPSYSSDRGTGCATCMPLGGEGGSGMGLDHPYDQLDWPDYLAPLGQITLCGLEQEHELPEDLDAAEPCLYTWAALGVDGPEPVVPAQPLEIMPVRLCAPSPMGGGSWVWPKDPPRPRRPTTQTTGGGGAMIGSTWLTVTLPAINE